MTTSVAAMVVGTEKTTVKCLSTTGGASKTAPSRADADVEAASACTRPSKNNRHDTFSDVKLFLEREYPDRKNTIEVVCSSARRDMDRCALHVPYKLFCQTLQLFPEYNTGSTGASAEPEWPTRTSIACWHDCHTFDTIPIPIPKTMRNPGNDSSNLYTVYGVFCSANCAVAYILDRNTYDQQQLIMLFKQMAVNVFNLPSTEVFAFQPAPPRIFLKLFGGHLSIDDFRRSSLKARNALLTPPFISYSMVLEENVRVSQARASELTHALLVKPPRSLSKADVIGEKKSGATADDGEPGQAVLLSNGVGAESAFKDTPVDCNPPRVTTTVGLATFLDAAPISTHTIRGLRRPTTDVHEGRALDTESSSGDRGAHETVSEGGTAGTTNTCTRGSNRNELKNETLFDTFIKRRNQATPRSTGDGVDYMVVDGDAQELPRSENMERSIPIGQPSVVSMSLCRTDDRNDGVDVNLHTKTGTADYRVDTGFYEALARSDVCGTTAGKLEKAKQGRPPCVSRAGVSTKKVDRRIPKNTVSKSESSSNGTSAFPAGLAVFQAGGTLAAFLKPYPSS